MRTIYLVEELTGNRWTPLLTTVRLTRRSAERELELRRAFATTAKYRLGTYSQRGR